MAGRGRRVAVLLPIPDQNDQWCADGLFGADGGSQFIINDQYGVARGAGRRGAVVAADGVMPAFHQLQAELQVIGVADEMYLADQWRQLFLLIEVARVTGRHAQGESRSLTQLRAQADLDRQGARQPINDR